MNYILIVDDDEDDVNVFCEALKEVSPELHCEYAFNAHEALKKLLELTILPELILLDLNMPIMTGKDMLALIKKDEVLKDVPVVIYSTSNSEKEKKELMQMGAYSFITKPDTYNDIKKVVKRLIG